MLWDNVRFRASVVCGVSMCGVCVCVCVCVCVINRWSHILASSSCGHQVISVPEDDVDTPARCGILSLLDSLLALSVDLSARMHACTHTHACARTTTLS